MERIKSLNGYQKGILLLLTVMLIAFTVAYFAVSSRVGFAYRDAILVPQKDGESTVYTGRIRGREAAFTITPDKTVTFSYGTKTYGPYVAREDSTAIPKDTVYEELMVGVELRQGEDIIFRGGVLPSGKNGRELMLFREDGSFADVNIMFTTNGILYDSDGNEIDQMAPSPSTLLHLMSGPELTSKGDWECWFGGVLLSVLTAVSILFADELFRWNLAFQIRHADGVEPSELEIAGRYISWTVLQVVVLWTYMMGLVM